MNLKILKIVIFKFTIIKIFKINKCIINDEIYFSYYVYFCSMFIWILKEFETKPAKACCNLNISLPILMPLIENH